MKVQGLNSNSSTFHNFFLEKNAWNKSIEKIKFYVYVWRPKIFEWLRIFEIGN